MIIFHYVGYNEAGRKIDSTYIQGSCKNSIGEWNTGSRKICMFFHLNTQHQDVIGKKYWSFRCRNSVQTSSGDSMMRRVIHVQDLKGNTIELSLSGKRATEFDGEKVLQVGQKHHVIAQFVGTLMKLSKIHTNFLVVHQLAIGTSMKMVFLKSKLFKRAFQPKLYQFRNCICKLLMMHNRTSRKEPYFG